MEDSMTNDGADGVFAHAAGEGDARWWLGGLAVIKATQEQTGGHYTLVEVHEPHGAEAPLHVHHQEDEGFWILEGELTFEIGGRTIPAGPGSFLFGPRGVPHRYTVDRGPARLLYLLSPGGFEELIHATSEPAEQLTLPPSPDAPPSDEEMEQLMAVVRCYGAEILP
jgi:mannose-6-phosphate isomerase-like protein (cupin superfamily)